MTDDLGPEIAAFEDPRASVVNLVSWHYDAMMQLRRIKLRDINGDTYWVVPCALPDGTLVLQRKEIDDD